MPVCNRGHRAKLSGRRSPRALPRNVWAAGVSSCLNDVSSEMVLTLLPLFLANALGVRTHLIGLIEGVAESTSSLVKVGSGTVSDRLRARKTLAVAGYALSALAKPCFYVAGSWGAVAAVRWADRVGKGVRSAPRDALVADSIDAGTRGLAFGFQRALDTGGAAVGIGIALALVWLTQRGDLALGAETFRNVVLASILPAVLAVVVLAFGARDIPLTAAPDAPPRLGLSALPRPFLVYLAIAAVAPSGTRRMRSSCCARRSAASRWRGSSRCCSPSTRSTPSSRRRRGRCRTGSADAA